MSDEKATSHQDVFDTLNQMRSIVSELVDKERLQTGAPRKSNEERKVQIWGRLPKKHKATLESHYNGKLSAVVERLLMQEVQQLKFRRAFGDAESWKACVDWANLRHTTELPVNLWTLRVKDVAYYVFDSDWNLLSQQPDSTRRAALSTIEIVATSERDRTAAIHWDGRPRKVYFLQDGQFSMASCPASEVFRDDDGVLYGIHSVGEVVRWLPQLPYSVEAFLLSEEDLVEWGESSPELLMVCNCVLQTLYLRAAECSLKEEEFSSLVLKARQLLQQLNNVSGWDHETCALFVESIL